MTFAPKINKIPEFYIIFARKIFSLILGPSTSPVSYAYAIARTKDVPTVCNKCLPFYLYGHEL